MEDSVQGNYSVLGDPDSDNFLPDYGRVKTDQITLQSDVLKSTGIKLPFRKGRCAHPVLLATVSEHYSKGITCLFLRSIGILQSIIDV